MTPSELLFKLQNLPPDTPTTAEHIVAILSSLQTAQTVRNDPCAYSTVDKDKLINPETLSEWIGETTACLYKWRYDGRGPKYVSKAKKIVYRVGDVRAWIKSRTVQSTTEAAPLGFS